MNRSKYMYEVGILQSNIIVLWKILKREYYKTKIKEVTKLPLNMSKNIKVKNESKYYNFSEV